MQLRRFMMAGQQPLKRASAAKGAIVVGAAQAYRVAITFVSNVILARLLLPEDFGLIAMVSTVLAFVAVIQDLGLNQATIQRPHVSHAQISALFWVQLAFGAT